MKKILLLTATILLLAGCGQQGTDELQTNNADVEPTYYYSKMEPYSGEITSYSNEELNISFDYPSSWELSEDETGNTIQLTSPTNNHGNTLIVSIPSESFEEYESINKDLIQENKMSITTTYMTSNKDNEIRGYKQHGWIYHITEFDGNYISTGSEQIMDHDQLIESIVIKNSISFKIKQT